MGSRRDENMCTVQDHFAAVVTAGPAVAGVSGDVTPMCAGTRASDDVEEDTTLESVSSHHHSKPYMNTEGGEEVNGQSPRQRDTTIKVGDSSNQLHPVAGCTQITGLAEFDPPTVVIDPSVQEQSMDDYSQLDMINHHTQREASRTENSPKHRDSSMEGEREKQHMQTQVSLEVVQCHSVATSPMTPPQGMGIDAFSFPVSSKSLEVVQCRSVATSPMTPPQGVGTNAFSFPASSERTGADTTDAELQLVRQVEFRSVATAPMTPKTPNVAGVTAVFPELSRRDGEKRMEEKVEEDRESEPVLAGPVFTLGLKCSIARQEQPGVSNVPPVSSANSAPQADKLCHNHTGEADPEQAGDKQRGKLHQAADSFDQEITILVTHHYGYEPQDEEEEVKQGLEIMSRLQSSTTEDVMDSEGLDESVLTGGSEVVPPVPQNSLDDGRSDDTVQPQVLGADINRSSGRTQQDDSPKTLNKNKPAEDKTKVCLSEGKSDHSEQRSLVEGSGKSSPNQKKKLQHPLVDTAGPASPSKPLQHMQTQVSLEVIQCHSVATSPMTPPQGVGTDAFSFPASSENLEVAQCHSVATSPMTPPQGVGTDAFSFPACSKNLEVAQCHSVATSPMTPPQGSSAGAFPFPASSRRPFTETRDAELQVGQRVECRSVATAPMTPKTPNTSALPATFPELVDTGGEKKEKQVQKAGGSTEDSSDEPIQEVRWDERGMTWEVYGAVVEVAVLGSAIQKHLEKQVKKLRRQPSPTLPPPPPLKPSAVPLRSCSPPTSGPTQGRGSARKRAELEEKRGRRQRNPFRLLLKNVQQPICCSRTHSAE